MINLLEYIKILSCEKETLSIEFDYDDKYEGLYLKADKLTKSQFYRLLDFPSTQKLIKETLGDRFYAIVWDGETRLMIWNDEFNLYL